MDAAWVGFAGVALGSVLTFVGTRWSERNRELREDHRRWHKPRLQAYVTTLNQLTVLVVETRAAIAAARPRLQPPWGPYRLKRQVGSAQVALRLALEQLELIRLTGSRPVRDAAEKCLEVLGRMSESLSAWSRATPDSVVDAFVQELEAAKVELRAAARIELNVDRPSAVRRTSIAAARE